MSPMSSKFSQWTHAHRRSVTHSAQVRLLRIFIPATAGIILLSLFLWSPLENMFASKGLYQGINPQDLTLRNTVINPQIHGVDAQGRPYHLQAQEARQTAPEKAHLTTPRGEIQLENNRRVTITSKTGAYEGVAQVLNCEKDVHLTTSDGYVVDADKASMSFETKQTEGTGCVNAQGPTGTLEGYQGFTLTQEGYLHVNGPSKLTLIPQQKPTSEPKNEQTP